MIHDHGRRAAKMKRSTVPYRSFIFGSSFVVTRKDEVSHRYWIRACSPARSRSIESHQFLSQIQSKFFETIKEIRRHPPASCSILVRLHSWTLYIQSRVDHSNMQRIHHSCWRAMQLLLLLLLTSLSSLTAASHTVSRFALSIGNRLDPWAKKSQSQRRSGVLFSEQPRGGASTAVKSMSSTQMAAFK